MRQDRFIPEVCEGQAPSPERIEVAISPSHLHRTVSAGTRQVELNPLFVRPGEATELPRTRLSRGGSLSGTTYQIVHNEVVSDGNARLNLATFVGTWMDDHANRLALESADKNMIDKDEYPRTAEIETRCWQMLTDLWHFLDLEHTIGISMIGSSKAVMLGGLASKRRWQQARHAAGKSAGHPNLVMSSVARVCWEKFCNHWDVEVYYVPVSRGHLIFDGHDLEHCADENTTGVVAIMGITYTGRYESVAGIAAVLDRIQAETGLDVKIRVDGTSGATVVPFLQPDLEWDFRLERVVFINTSGHKYELVYPGLGWVVWYTTDDLPGDLVFRVSYLGGDVPTFALNLSRPGSQVLLQCYLFLRLGLDGYRRVHEMLRLVATFPSDEIDAMDDFELCSDGTDIPALAWYLTQRLGRNWGLYDLSDRLRMKGWLMPIYPLPNDLADELVQRTVVRNGSSHDLIHALLDDLRHGVGHLNALTAPMPATIRQPNFHH